MSTLAVIRAAPESEPFATHRTIIQLPARVLGVVAVMVGLCLVALAADVAEVRPLLLVNAFDVVPQPTFLDESPTTNDANELRRRRCRSRH